MDDVPGAWCPFPVPLSRTMGLSSTSFLFSLFKLGTRIGVWFEILIFKD